MGAPEESGDGSTHFGFRTVAAPEKARKVAEVFDSVSPSYDRMNDLMSAGLHRYWKKFTVEQAALRPGMKVLDIAGGTGDLARAFARRVGSGGEVWLTDINRSESCFHMATMYGQRFGMLVFIDRMAARYLEQIRGHGLAGHCVGVEPVGFGFNDVLDAFGKPGAVIDRFRAAARRLIDAGADVIVPGEIPLNVLLASEGVNRIDDVPLVDSLAVTLKMAEMMVDLKSSTGLAPSRRGWSNAAPPRARVRSVLDFYGLGGHLGGPRA